MEGILIAVITAVLTAAATGGVSLFWNRAGKKLDMREEEKAQQMQSVLDTLELLKKANQMVLRDRLWQKCKAHLDEGYCPQDDKAQIRDMYEVYHALGKNGVMDRDVQCVYDLPIASKGE